MCDGLGAIEVWAGTSCGGQRAGEGTKVLGAKFKGRDVDQIGDRLGTFIGARYNVITLQRER
jgi:hypothetical protein